METKEIRGSFRDPSGFVFIKDNVVYRQINNEYKENYDFLLSSGLYKELVQSKMLVPHKEVSNEFSTAKNAYKVIKPEIINFLSYPYEWSFTQLKDAALLTLEIQKKALDFGMMLKDCSTYNIQFKDGKPILIDTLSFEKYDKEKQWVAAYRQFCRHFLATLSLMSYVNVSLNQLLRNNIDGIPLDLASSLLPKRTYLKMPLFYHIHFSAKLQRFYTDKTLNTKKFSLDKKKLYKLVEKLKYVVEKLTWKPEKTEWADYYDMTNYSSIGFEHKKQLVKDFLKKVNPKSVLDLGANTGIFSRIASNMSIFTLSVDNDPAAVEKNYLQAKKRDEKYILPLLIDLTNPSPNIGWDNEERISFLNRVKVDAGVALALIHHLAISNNLPMREIAIFLNKFCKSLIIEFVPKNDSQVRKLISRREDIFLDYTQETFESEFKEYYKILESKKIKNSERTLYLMEGKI